MTITGTLTFLAGVLSPLSVPLVPSSDLPDDDDDEEVDDDDDDGEEDEEVVVTLVVVVDLFNSPTGADGVFAPLVVVVVVVVVVVDLTFPLANFVVLNGS